MAHRTRAFFGIGVSTVTTPHWEEEASVLGNTQWLGPLSQKIALALVIYEIKKVTAYL